MTPASVLINTFNHERFIGECVDSVLSQDPRPEVVAYDDGSRDRTPQILRGYGDRIRLIAARRVERPAHLAQANAVQEAFEASSGPVVFLLDGDDRFRPGKVARYLEAFERHPDASLVQAPMDKIDFEGRLLGRCLEPRKHIVDHLQAIYRQHDVDFYYPSSSLAFSRQYLERILPLDFSDGLPLWLDTRLSITAPYFGRVVMLPDPLTEWRRHAGSHSLAWPQRGLQIRQTLMRTRVFNAFCRRHGLKTISPWRNGRFYLQLARYALPPAVYDFVYRRAHPRPGQASPS